MASYRGTQKLPDWPGTGVPLVQYSISDREGTTICFRGKYNNPATGSYVVTCPQGTYFLIPNNEMLACALKRCVIPLPSATWLWVYHDGKGRPGKQNMVPALVWCCCCFTRLWMAIQEQCVTFTFCDTALEESSTYCSNEASRGITVYDIL